MKHARLNLPKSLVVPLFPLPNAILFPGARLPLYIFEPRYKQMIDDTLKQEHLLSITLVSDDEGKREPAEICGLGQITDLESLPNNEKNIVVTGLVRVRIVREVSIDPYISAEVRPLKQKTPARDGHERLFARLRDAVKTWLFRMRSGNIRQLAELGGCGSVAEMCDFFGAYLLDDHATRQQLLAELNVSRRAEIIIELVKTELYRYSAPFEN